MRVCTAYELEVTGLEESENLDALLKGHNRSVTMDPGRENIEVKTSRLTGRQINGAVELVVAIIWALRSRDKDQALRVVIYNCRLPEMVVCDDVTQYEELLDIIGEFPRVQPSQCVDGSEASRITAHVPYSIAYGLNNEHGQDDDRGGVAIFRPRRLHFTWPPWLALGHTVEEINDRL